MSPVTLPVPTIDDLMRSLGITDAEILEDLLYPAGRGAVGPGGDEGAHPMAR